jgi:hypothetical protein
MQDTNVRRRPRPKDVLFAVAVGVLATVFLLGLTSCVAQAQGVTAAEPTLSLATLLTDPLTFLVSKLGGVAAIIYVLIEGAKHHAPFLKDGTERAGLYLFLTALVLGVVAGLVGAVEPMPGAIPVAGKVFSGLGAGALAVTGFNGVRAFRRAKAEKVDS